ncbi:MAG: TonB family protein [Alphaproteobacteria bacterium]
MNPFRSFGPWLRRHPLAIALTASIALHGTALAAYHYLWPGTAPTPAEARTIALVMVEDAPPTPDARDSLARPESETPPNPTVDSQPNTEQFITNDFFLYKKFSPRANEERHAAAPPLVPPPPRRPPVPAKSGSEPGPDLQFPTATESEPKPHPETAVMPPSPPVASERTVPTSAGNVDASKSGQHALGRTIPPRYGISGFANPRPRYPWLSRQKGEEGRVVLRVAVDEEGRAIDVTVLASSGHGRLDRAAASAVRRWRFAPANNGGRAIVGAVDVPVTFRLSDG